MIKPCPFCGSIPTIFDTGNYFPVVYYRIICSIHCCMQSKLYDSKEKAIIDWNKRYEENKEK